MSDSGRVLGDCPHGQSEYWCSICRTADEAAWEGRLRELDRVRRDKDALIKSQEEQIALLKARVEVLEKAIKEMAAPGRFPEDGPAEAVYDGTARKGHSGYTCFFCGHGVQEPDLVFPHTDGDEPYHRRCFSKLLEGKR